MAGMHLLLLSASDHQLPANFRPIELDRDHRPPPRLDRPAWHQRDSQAARDQRRHRVDIADLEQAAPAKARSAGFQMHMAKPVEPAALISSIMALARPAA